MTFANLLRFGRDMPVPLHLVMIDRQPAFGEGVAYRTNDPRHLLNVPAGKMSAWPDRPDDFLHYSQAHEPSVKPGDFLPRKKYGPYIRQILLDLAESSPAHLSGKMIHDEATVLQPAPVGWTVQTASGRTVRADAVIFTMGHRPPDDPLRTGWTGPHNRFVGDPWAALVLSQVEPNESVLLLGSGLTAIDAVLTLNHRERTAPITIVSRHGLMPQPHLREAKPAADVSDLAAQWLESDRPLTAHRLVSALRKKVEEDTKAGSDWRQIIDGLRPLTSKIWSRLSTIERTRFVHRLRPYWEIHRHRMAPDIADSIHALRQAGKIKLMRGTVVSASADDTGVDVVLSNAGNTKRTVRAAWVINCTGPGAHNRHSTHPILRPLLEAGTILEDELHLGLETNANGQALNARGGTNETLFVAGTLRKSTLWESTAVPELRQQAQSASQYALEMLLRLPT
jgi:uncharacterized NAD(P)/FAD-binding protein YdhS